MIPLVKAVMHSLIWDQDAARRWVLGAVGTFGAGGAMFAAEIAATVGAPKLVTTIRVLAALCAFAAGTISPARPQK